jgi:hypothetical protein
MEVFNGHSSRFVEGLLCTDTPDSWYEGWIALEAPPEIPCDMMQRDDCIEDPRCVLWGSESYDPGYVCMDASGSCEVLAEVAECGRNPSCIVDTGGCYYPEGFDCICAGGPAPKCRSTCGGFGGLNCPGGRYCDEFGIQAPNSCGPVPDGTGQCEWQPTSCAGTPNGPVCACGNNGPQDFENDCLRRQVQAAGPVAEMCAP